MRSTALKPQSIRLTLEEQDDLRKIAAELGVTEHALRHFAVQRLITDWKRGWRKQMRSVVTFALRSNDT